MKNRFRHALAVFAIALLPTPYLCAQVDVAAGSKTFSTNCAGCHGSDGRGGERAPNIATARNIVSLTDKDLAGFIRNGITGSGMPAFGFLGDDGIRDVVAFLRQLQGKTTTDVKLTGDQASGRALFFGKADCSSCHMMHGEGGFLASDLSDYGSGIAPERIRAAIVGPETFVTPGSEVVEFTTLRGESLRGVLRSEDNFNIVVQLQNGRYRRFTKSSLKKLTHTGHSLMPADYGSRLSSAQIDDIVTFLVRSADPIDPSSRRRRSKAD
ncbi:c-type cytochrome [Edaphobacter albus]|uniref:c-type cytochrome n=1 Tax=Edaphobacter sp. 4G125 TaxID=2763071 RepID=UPI0016463CDF|nr:c-type cytochrome [Edaphobacter sp. 4G125]QNI36643.1 c-type cytochrome [Edaphobacter sp. 4G125]